MEINKEEAIRCLRIAKNHYGNKNYDAAVRLTQKSIKLYPTEEAKEFLVKAEQAAAKAGPEEIKKETKSTSSTQSSSSSSFSSSTQQQSQEVKEILACGTDYYKVLKLNRSCTEVEIKKAYRKVSRV
ncbi:hypothetical protein RMATCC62417_01152 [Rhizopus microsporus]|nr:hypothetical protein RMATCC62417_01152 [Rhizopus microsporus]